MPTPAPRTPARVRNQTIRQVVRTSIGGSQVRVTLTNLFGTEPLEIGAAHVAGHPDGAAMGAGAHLTFGGHPSVTIEAGSTVLSDPVALAVASLSDLVIDLYVPGDTWGSTSPATMHLTGLSTTYVSTPGNHVAAEQFDDERDTQQWFYLSRVDVWTETAPGAIVAMGDSSTDGSRSTVDANRRWPDFLARRLAAEYGDAAPGVLNVGIAGNRVLSHNAGFGFRRRVGDSGPPDTGNPPNPNALFGPSALSRFDREVLLQPGATHVIVLETTNDIGMAFGDPWPSVDDLIAGHRTLIQRAHAQGLTVYGGTLLPFEGAFYWTEAGETKRQALNAWIRTSGAYDGVIDFDAAVRDPEQPTRFRWDLHAGDWLHPSDAGYEAMANAIDLSLFDPRAQRARAAQRHPRIDALHNVGTEQLVQPVRDHRARSVEFAGPPRRRPEPRPGNGRSASSPATAGTAGESRPPPTPRAVRGDAPWPPSSPPSHAGAAAAAPARRTSTSSVAPPPGSQRRPLVHDEPHRSSSSTCPGRS